MNKRMASLFLALMLLAFLTPRIYAQNNMGLSAWGVKAGLDMSRFTGKDAKTAFGKNLEYEPGATAGLFATYRFNNTFAVQPELLYSVRGSRWTSTDDTPAYKARIDYVEIPILAKAEFPTQGSFQPNLYIGPDFAFRVRARETIPGQSSQVNIKSDVKSSDIGMALGAGTGYALSHGQITADARYILGFSKIDNTQSNLAIHNGTFSFILGYSFK